MAGDYQVPVQGEMKGWMGGGQSGSKLGEEGSDSSGPRVPAMPGHETERKQPAKRVPSEATHLYLSW